MAGLLDLLGARLGGDGGAMLRPVLGDRRDGLLGALSRMPDRDRDGSIADDVGGLLGGLLGRR